MFHEHPATGFATFPRVSTAPHPLLAPNRGFQEAATTSSSSCAGWYRYVQVWGLFYFSVWVNINTNFHNFKYFLPQEGSLRRARFNILHSQQPNYRPVGITELPSHPGSIRINTLKIAKHSDNAKWHWQSKVRPIKE